MSPEHKEDPAAKILGERPEIKITKADHDYFMKTVSTAMRVLNQHPETRTVEDERGKPIVQEVVDDVELPGGEEERVWVKVRPAPDAYGDKLKGLPVISITVADKFDTIRKGRRVDHKSGQTVEYEYKAQPVTRVEYFGDGTISVDDADSIEDLQAVEAPPDDGSNEWYEKYGKAVARQGTVFGYTTHLEEFVKDVDVDPDTNELVTIDDVLSRDWEGFDMLQPALQALVDKL